MGRHRIGTCKGHRDGLEIATALQDPHWPGDAKLAGGM
jgi:hypothetical protein